MNSDREDKIEEFYCMVEEQIDNGVLYRDAIELSAVTVGGLIPAKVSQAMNKFQEAIHPQSHLSQEENRDALALLSMGVLWDNTYFKPIAMDPGTDLENTLAEAIYFIMIYGREENGLEKALEANQRNGGDVQARAKVIQRVLSKV